MARNGALRLIVDCVRLEFIGFCCVFRQKSNIKSHVLDFTEEISHKFTRNYQKREKCNISLSMQCLKRTETQRQAEFLRFAVT